MVRTADSALIREGSLIQSVLYREAPLCVMFHCIGGLNWCVWWGGRSVFCVYAYVCVHTCVHTRVVLVTYNSVYVREVPRLFASSAVWVV